MLFSKPFYKALEKCSEDGGNLASMHSAVENNLLQDFAARHVSLQVATWVGLHSPAKDCNFQWSDGTPLKYTNWYPGYPSCAPNSAPYFCVPMITDVDGEHWSVDKIANIWTNVCYLNYNAVCQKEPTIV
ncbi:C-type lectin-2 [Aphelenchoides avenae]|nr:C-type lectin-2 [Aphelenchus avenae]